MSGAVFKEVRLSDDKVLVPGVIDICTNYVEHPEAVAQHIERHVGVRAQYVRRARGIGVVGLPHVFPRRKGEDRRPSFHATVTESGYPLTELLYDSGRHKYGPLPGWEWPPNSTRPL
jgi:hypothetical protein